MTCKCRFGNSRFAGSYLPYGLFVLISLISLALAGCSGASPTAGVPDPTPGATTTAPVTPATPQQSTESTVTILADSDTVEAGQPVSYTVNASPAPTTDLAVHVAYTNTGVELAAEPSHATITIDAGSDAAMLTVLTATGPGGTITASVTDGDGYTVGPADSASVTVTASSTDGGSTTGPVITSPRPPANSVIITAVTPSVVEGNLMRFRVTAEPAPVEDLELNLRIKQTIPARVRGHLPSSVTIPASTNSVEFTLTATNDSVPQRAGMVIVRLTGVASGPATYRIGSPDSATVTVTDDEGSVDYSVIISAVRATVIEGSLVRFRVTAVRAPEEDLTLSANVTLGGPTRTAGNLPTSVTIRESTHSQMLLVRTTNDSVSQRAGTVTATLTGVASGPATYHIGSPDSATVAIADDDDPSTATIGLPDSVSENDILTITVNMSPALAAAAPQTVRVIVIDSGPDHLMARSYSVTFGADDVLQTVTHTVIAGHGAATGRITAELTSAPADAPYVLGNPYKGSVDVN